MNRQLKFREWLGKEFHYWGFMEDDSFILPTNIKGPQQQMTGLLDKNGKEIYEGDILASGERVIGHIEGGVRGYCYDVVYFKPRHDKRWSLYASVTDDYEGKVEVVGNIYENPDLLK